MTPKEFFTIWHLLHNGSFLYDYYEHATYKKRGREYNKYHDKYKVVTKETKNFKSGDKQLIDIKNKIKNKIRKSLDENKINVKNFEKEFDAFIQIKHWYTEPLSKNDCILKTHYIKNISLCSDEDYVKFIKNYCLNPIID